MTLNIDDLGTVWEALFDVCAKAYNIGLKLKVPVGRLESIRKQYSDPSDQLREILKAWLEMAAQQKWQTIVDTLRSRIIGEPKLASDIEAEYCQDTPVQASGQAMPRDTQMEALQQQVMALQQHLESKTEPQETVKRLEKKLREQQRAIEAMQTQREVKQPQSMKRPSARPQANPPQQEMKLRKLIWRDSPKAPEAMARGSLAIDGTTVYCIDTFSTSVHQYNSDTQQWSTLPNPLPLRDSTLVMADSKLTSVGGQYQGGAMTNSLLSLTGEGRDRKWLEYFPPMPTKRSGTAAICHGRSLIVAGGMITIRETTATVEVLNMDTQFWSIASSPPHPFTDATTSICGERLYLLGGQMYPGIVTRSVLACSISKLLHSCQTLTQSTIWQRVTDAQYASSSCATLCGQLIIVGGIHHESLRKYKAVSAYDETTNSWVAMEAMKTPRCNALVASLHDNTMLVIGGSGLDTVEIAKLS